MDTRKAVAQFRRELHENKTGFFIIPLLITALLLASIIFSALYMGDRLSTLNHEFQMKYSDGNHVDQPKTDDFFVSVAKDQPLFGNMLVASVQINSLILAVVFFIVLLGYSHRCLFDDRKNREILFWRSLPVSETVNVLVKLAVTLFIAPIVMLVLNLIVWTACLIIGLVLFASHGIALDALLASVVNNAHAWIVFHVFIISTFGSLALMPVIGFILCASAFAKKSPFFTSTFAPIFLVIADKIIYTFFGFNLHIEDALRSYTTFWLSINHVLSPIGGVGVTMDFASGFVLSVAVGIVFVVVAVWLRNYRYEI